MVSTAPECYLSRKIDSALKKVVQNKDVKDVFFVHNSYVLFQISKNFNVGASYKPHNHNAVYIIWQDKSALGSVG